MRFSVEQNFTFSSTKQSTDTFSFAFSEGLKVGVSSKVGVDVWGFEVSGEFSFEQSQTITATKDRAWAVNQPVVVPAHSRVKLLTRIMQRQLHGKFIATYTVSLTQAGLTFTNNMPLDVAFPGINRQLQTTGQVSGVGGVDAVVTVTEAPLRTNPPGPR